MTKADKTLGLVRYFRAQGFFDTPDGPIMADGNMGGITFGINIRHADKEIDVAFTICKANENFSKQFGRDSVLTDLDDGTFITLPYDSDETLIMNIVDGLEHYKGPYDKYELSMVQTLRQKMKTIYKHDAICASIYEDAMFDCMVNS